MNSFNPEKYNDDIIVVDMQSQGRARGFKVVNEYSALGDEVLTRRIADRMRLILKLIEGDTQSPLMIRNTRLEDQVEELEDDVKAFLSELNVANKRIRELEEGDIERYDELLYMVNEVLGEVYAVGFSDLDSAVRALIEEYDDLAEESEDEG